MADPHRSTGFTLIEQYYRHFNERRLTEAAALLADNAEVDAATGQPEQGPMAYVRFAERWVAAFPNAIFTIERIDQRSASMCEVHLRAAGTHQGMLDIAGCRFRPSGAEANLRLREVLEVRDDRIVLSVLSINIGELIEQLSTIDYDELTRRSQHIGMLATELAQTADDLVRRRDVAHRLGIELDAARRAIRPYYDR